MWKKETNKNPLSCINCLRSGLPTVASRSSFNLEHKSHGPSWNRTERTERGLPLFRKRSYSNDSRNLFAYDAPATVGRPFASLSLALIQKFFRSGGHTMQVGLSVYLKGCFRAAGRWRRRHLHTTGSCGKRIDKLRPYLNVIRVPLVIVFACRALLQGKERLIKVMLTVKTQCTEFESLTMVL